MSSYSKDEIFKAVLNAAIELDIEKGFLNWTYTELSKRASISRTLIYYYFGKSKVNVLKEACHLFGKELSGRNEERTKLWQISDISAGLDKTRDLFKECPTLINYYFLNRYKNNEIGDLIRNYEQEAIEKRKEFFPNLSESAIRVMYAFHLGLTTASDLNKADLQLADQLFQKVINEY